MLSSALKSDFFFSLQILKPPRGVLRPTQAGPVGHLLGGDKADPLSGMDMDICQDWPSSVSLVPNCGCPVVSLSGVAPNVGACPGPGVSPGRGTGTSGRLLPEAAPASALPGTQASPLLTCSGTRDVVLAV